MMLNRITQIYFTRPYLFVTVVLLTGLAFFGCKSEEKKDDQNNVEFTIGEPLSDQSLAALVSSEYGTDTLTTSQFRNKISVFLRQYPQIESNDEQLRQLRRGLVEDFAIQHALLGEAGRIGLSADSAVINDRIQAFQAQFPDRSTFLQTLAENNIPEDSLSLIIHDALVQEMLFEHFQSSVTGPTEDEIEQYREQQSEEIRAQHILFLTSANLTQDDEDLLIEGAEAVLDSAKAGIDFSSLAKRHSGDGSAQLGGDLGFFRHGQMVAPFEEAAFALADSGDVTQDLVRTQYGYHIIRLTGRREGEKPDATTALQTIMRERNQKVVEENLDLLRAKLTLRLNEGIVDADINSNQG